MRFRIQEVLEVETCQCSREDAILTIPVAEISMLGQPATTISYEDPPPRHSGAIGIRGSPSIIHIIPYGHYYWVGGST